MEGVLDSFEAGNGASAHIFCQCSIFDLICFLYWERITGGAMYLLERSREQTINCMYEFHMKFGRSLSSNTRSKHRPCLRKSMFIVFGECSTRSLWKGLYFFFLFCEWDQSAFHHRAVRLGQWELSSQDLVP